MSQSMSHVCPQLKPVESVSVKKSATKCKQVENNLDQSTVIVIGALSFLGSRIISDLIAQGLRVHALVHVEDTSTEWETKHLIWYRRDQLQQLGVFVDTVDFSNQTQVESKVMSMLSKSAVTQIVYVPTLVTDRMYSGFDSVRMSNQVEEFVNLLELLRQVETCTRVLLVSDFTSPYLHVTSHDIHMSVQSAWVDAFELMLSTYHSLYSIPITVVRTHGVYGPWSGAALQLYTNVTESNTNDSNRAKIVQSRYGLNLCWYINDITKSLYRALALNTDCAALDLGGCKVQDSNEEKDSQYSTTLHSLTHETKRSWTTLGVLKDELHTKDKGIMKTLTWAKAYTSTHSSRQDKRKVVFTSYFTTMVDAQRSKHKQPNRFAYMANWYKSIKRLSLIAVIFHDGLQPDFQHRITQYHPGVSFEYLHSLNQRSTNDARFYAYLRYIEKHPEIDNVILTDISDVEFQMDPFELMDTLGDWLYIGTDIDIFPSMQTMPWIHKRLRNCFGNHSVENGILHSLMDMDTVYNAGIIGGTRATVMSVLSRIVGYLDTTPPDFNCNMPAVNVAVHKHFFRNVFTGFPLNSRFLRKQVSPKGVYIVHK